jgi:hypothetical protein
MCRMIVLNWILEKWGMECVQLAQDQVRNALVNTMMNMRVP